MIIILRDPYNGAEKMYNLDKFQYAYPSIDGGYELIFDGSRHHMDYKEYERFKKAVNKLQNPTMHLETGCTCGADIGASRPEREAHSSSCPRRQE